MLEDKSSIIMNQTNAVSDFSLELSETVSENESIAESPLKRNEDQADSDSIDSLLAWKIRSWSAASSQQTIGIQNQMDFLEDFHNQQDNQIIYSFQPVCFAAIKRKTAKPAGTPNKSAKESGSPSSPEASDSSGGSFPVSSTRSHSTAGSSPRNILPVMVESNEEAHRLLKVTQSANTRGQNGTVTTTIEVFDTSNPKQLRRLFAMSQPHWTPWQTQLAIQRFLLVAVILSSCPCPPELPIEPALLRFFTQRTNKHHLHLFMDKVAESIVFDDLPVDIRGFWWRPLSCGGVVLHNMRTGKMMVLPNRESTLWSAMNTMSVALKILENPAELNIPDLMFKEDTQSDSLISNNTPIGESEATELLNNWIYESSLRQDNSFLCCKHRLNFSRDKLFDFNFALSVKENPLSLNIELNVQSCLSPSMASKTYSASPMSLHSGDPSKNEKPSLLPIKVSTIGALRNDFLEARWLITKLFQAQSQLTPHATASRDTVSRDCLQRTGSDFEFEEPTLYVKDRVALKNTVALQPLPVDASGRATSCNRLRGIPVNSNDDMSIQRKNRESFPLKDPYQNMCRMPVISLKPTTKDFSSLMVDKQENSLGRDIISLTKEDLTPDTLNSSSVFCPERNWLTLNKTDGQPLILHQEDRSFNKPESVHSSLSGVSLLSDRNHKPEQRKPQMLIVPPTVHRLQDKSGRVKDSPNGSVCSSVLDIEHMDGVPLINKGPPVSLTSPFGQRQTPDFPSTNRLVDGIGKPQILGQRQLLKPPQQGDLFGVPSTKPFTKPYTQPLTKPYTQPLTKPYATTSTSSLSSPRSKLLDEYEAPAWYSGIIPMVGVDNQKLFDLCCPDAGTTRKPKSRKRKSKKQKRAKEEPLKAIEMTFVETVKKEQPEVHKKHGNHHNRANLTELSPKSVASLKDEMMGEDQQPRNVDKNHRKSSKPKSLRSKDSRHPSEGVLDNEAVIQVVDRSGKSQRKPEEGKSRNPENSTKSRRSSSGSSRVSYTPTKDSRRSPCFCGFPKYGEKDSHRSRRTPENAYNYPYRSNNPMSDSVKAGLDLEYPYRKTSKRSSVKPEDNEDNQSRRSRAAAGETRSKSGRSSRHSEESRPTNRNRSCEKSCTTARSEYLSKTSQKRSLVGQLDVDSMRMRDLAQPQGAYCMERTTISVSSEAIPQRIAVAGVSRKQSRVTIHNWCNSSAPCKVC